MRRSRLLRTLRLEMLEDRRLLAVLVVDDDGGGAHTTIQAAINAAAAGDTIQITGGADRTHTEQGISVNKNLTIKGAAGATQVIVQAHAQEGRASDRVMTVNSTATIDKLTIRHGNTATGDGGGIFNSGTLTVTGSIVSNNRALLGGGGIFNNLGGTLAVIDSAVSDNTAGDDGGGISNDSTLTVIGSRVLDNMAGVGGGIFSRGTLVVIDSTVAGNTTVGDGGGIFSRGSLAVTDSTVSGNTASDGGGIYNNGTLAMTNSTVSGNTAGGVGGGINNSDTLTVTGSTLSGNTAVLGGGGIFNAGTLAVNNTIVTGSNGGDLAGGGTGDNNLSDDAGFPGRIGTTGVTNLGPLANNGGPTQTHALLPGSNAIDAGDNALIPLDENDIDGDSTDLLPFDQRGPGFPRIVNLTVDVGAVEFGTAADRFLVTTEIDENNGTADPAMGTGTSLREAIIDANADPYNVSTITIVPALDGTSLVLTITGSDEDASATGDLDINSTIIIEGNGPANTIIDAGGIGDRVLDVLSGRQLTLRDSTVTGGNTAASGGGIDNAGTLTVIASTVSGNTAGFGGGIFNNFGSTLAVIGSTIAANTAVFGGGGIFNFGGTLTVNHSTLWDNKADGGGGIFSNLGGTLAVNQSTLSGNTAAGDGGGIFNGGTLTVTSSTLSGNTADSGGGIFLYNDDGTLAVNNTIVTDSTGGDLVGDRSTGSNNLSDDDGFPGRIGTTGVTNLGPLADNGGPTQTHALLPGSNAIDAGDNALFLRDKLDLDGDGDTKERDPFDQRGPGFNRVVNGTVDIGAFENACNLVVRTTADSGDGSLRSAIQCSNDMTGMDTISFDIPGPGPHTITPLSPLPAIRDAAVIDGTSEPDYAGTPVVELDGSSTGARAKGLLILAGPSEVRGLAINGFADVGIQLGRSDGHLIQGNFIGTEVSGTVASPNGTGIRLSQSSNNTIGTAATPGGNVISGNTKAGIRVAGKTATGNNIWNNKIGTDAIGNAAVPNGSGVEIVGGPGNLVGGDVGPQSNVISGNTTFGVVLQSDNNRVVGNRIGTNAAGDAPIRNNDGVRIIAGTGNTIGGTAPRAGNLISGNRQSGVELAGGRATGNMVQGNLIGVDDAGTAALGNRVGIFIDRAPSNTIGSTALGAGNVISGNSRHGVLLEDAGATGNLIQANQIGTNQAGDGPVANLHGITIDDAGGNTIGGTATGAGNVISGNSHHGVRLLNVGATGNTVQGNRIGVNAGGDTAIPNGQDGVFLARAVSDNTIGGSAPGAANEIANNNGRGVFVTRQAGTGNRVSQNSIHDNGGLGIDLSGRGQTDNDAGDADTGGNNVQNFPEMTTVILDGANVDITYSIPTTAANSAFPITVEFFLADGDDEEGQTFLGSHTYSSVGSTTADDIPGGGATAGTKIVATATDNNGNTSEFSTAVIVSESLLAAGGDASRESRVESQVLDQSQLMPIVDASIDRLAAAGFASKLFANVEFAIADLPGAVLGLAAGNTITVDVNAAGYGWFVSSASRVKSQEPEDSDEYNPQSSIRNLQSIDLLTVVMHELGHVAGLEDLHDAENDLMYGWLNAGVRRTSSESSLANAAFADLWRD